MFSDDGRVISILCVSRNTTSEREIAFALRESQERLEIATKVGMLGIWDYNLITQILECDDTWYKVMGRDPASPVRSLEDFKPFIHPEDVAKATEVSRTADELVRTQNDYSLTFRIIRSDGEIRWVNSAACLIQDITGRPVRAVGFVMDVTDSQRGQEALQEANRSLKQETALLSHESRSDPLTGLPNRRALMEALLQISDHVALNDTDLSVVMIDLDYFKQYNDLYGHVAGDDALVRFSKALKSVTRRNDIVGRYGGEEFLMLLPETNNAAPILDRLVLAVKEMSVVHEGSPFGVGTLSCGCATFKSNELLKPDAMIARADAALYRAKSEGRNRYIIE